MSLTKPTRRSGWPIKAFYILIPILICLVSGELALRAFHHFRPSFVGVGEIGSSDQPANTHGVEQIGLGSEARFDIAQAFPESQLGEGHAKELIPCGKALALPGHGIVGYATIEMLPMDHVDNLRENETASIHAFQSQ